MKKKELFAEKKFKVTFKNIPEVTYNVTITRDKSGAFNYGNGTCVVVKGIGDMPMVYDTRYDGSVMKDFNGWCNEFLEGYFDPKYGPNVKEVA